jgi:hypothetical protein
MQPQPRENLAQRDTAAGSIENTVSIAERAYGGNGDVLRRPKFSTQKARLHVVFCNGAFGVKSLANASRWVYGKVRA